MKLVAKLSSLSIIFVWSFLSTTFLFDYCQEWIDNIKVIDKELSKWKEQSIIETSIIGTEKEWCRIHHRYCGEINVVYDYEIKKRWIKYGIE